MQFGKFGALIITFLVIALGAFPSRAFSTPLASSPSPTPKAPPMPLFIGANNGVTLDEGDTWVWDGKRVIKYTINGHNYLPVVSPTGDSFVYQQVTPAFVTQRVNNASLEDEESPTDIYLYNLKTRQPSKIAGQPSKPAFVNDGTARYILRSTPSWSPDGKLLAWTEIEVEQSTNADRSDERLMLYDTTTGKLSALVDPLPPHRNVSDDFPTLSQVSFGPKGLIAVLVYVSETVDPNRSDALLVFDTNGKKLIEIDQLSYQDSDFDVSQLIWLSGGQTPYVSCITCEIRVAPLSGMVLAMPGTVEMYSLLAPDRLSLYFGTDSGDESNVTWVVAMKGKQVSTFASVRISSISDAAISPDGMQIATANYSGQGTTAGVFLYEAQNKRTISIRINVTGLGWGPVGWRLRPDPTQYF